MSASGEYSRGWNDAIEAAAKAIRDQDRSDHEWVPGSLWDALYRRFAPSILRLKQDHSS